MSQKHNEDGAAGTGWWFMKAFFRNHPTESVFLRDFRRMKKQLDVRNEFRMRMSVKIVLHQLRFLFFRAAGLWSSAHPSASSVCRNFSCFAVMRQLTWRTESWEIVADWHYRQNGLGGGTPAGLEDTCPSILIPGFPGFLALLSSGILSSDHELWHTDF